MIKAHFNEMSHLAILRLDLNGLRQLTGSCLVHSTARHNHHWIHGNRCVRCLRLALSFHDPNAKLLNCAYDSARDQIRRPLVFQFVD